MQTLILCYEQTWRYELYDQEALTLHQVKDYDGMDFAASKAFQLGVSSEQL